jgi:hypothetical protein
VLGKPHSDLAFLDFSPFDNGNEAHAQAEQCEVSRLRHLTDGERATIVEGINVGDTQLENRTRGEAAGKTDVPPASDLSVSAW